MARWYEAANESSFKPIAEGYVFQSPNPWVFARPRYYHVNAAQKAELLVVLGRWRLSLIVCLLIIFAMIGSFVAFVTLSPATVLRLVRPALEYGSGVFAVLLFAVLMLLIVPLLAVPQICLHRGLQAPLASAPRTEERITMAEQLPNIAKAVSGKLLAMGLVGGLCLLGAAILDLAKVYLEGQQFRGLLFPFLPLLVLGGSLTAYFAYLMRLRSKLKTAAV